MYQKCKIRGGLLFDGNKICKNNIFEINIKSSSNKNLIDASGCIITPALLDVHTHYDFLLNDPSVFKSELSQGVGTFAGGLCGFEPISVSKAYREASSFLSHGSLSYYESHEAFHEFLRGNRFPINIIQFLGTSPLLYKYVDKNKLSNNDLDDIADNINSLFKKFPYRGISFGLFYYPANKLLPVNALKYLLSKLNIPPVPFIYHLKNERNKILEAIEDVINIHKDYRYPLHISHIKVAGENNWGKMKQVIKIIEFARDNYHLNITCDVYPFTAGSTTLKALIPNSFSVNNIGSKKCKAVLQREMRNGSLNWKNIYIANIGNQSLVGRSFFDITKSQMASLDLFINCTKDHRCNDATIIRFAMNQDDIDMILAKDFCMVASDSFGTQADGATKHPRSFSTFSKLIFQNKDDKNKLKRVLYKMTVLPSKTFMCEELVDLKSNRPSVAIIDLNKLKYDENYFSLNKPSVGLKSLIVNGKFVCNNYKLINGSKDGILL
jgi:N-acyl-D-aspartate/D-glutamate deacylase